MPPHLSNMVEINAPWKPGRQGTAYRIKKLLEVGWRNRGFDVYLIHYQPGNLPMHVDAVPLGIRHFRLNVILSGDGEFVCQKTILRWRRFILFRPDLHEHGVIGMRRERWVFSIGVAV